MDFVLCAFSQNTHKYSPMTMSAAVTCPHEVPALLETEFTYREQSLLVFFNSCSSACKHKVSESLDCVVSNFLILKIAF